MCPKEVEVGQAETRRGGKGLLFYIKLCQEPKVNYIWGAQDKPQGGLWDVWPEIVESEVVVRDKRNFVQRRGMLYGLLVGVMQRGEEREGREEVYKI